MHGDASAFRAAQHGCKSRRLPQVRGPQRDREGVARRAPRQRSRVARVQVLRVRLRIFRSSPARDA